MGGHPRRGPQFRGAKQVQALFEQLITTFPDIWWQEWTTHPKVTPVPRLYSNDASKPATVGVQTTLFGTHKSPWFQDVRYSLPLSAIKPSNKATEAPSFAVFAFGGKMRRAYPSCHSIWIAIAKCAKCRRITITPTSTPICACF